MATIFTSPWYLFLLALLLMNDLVLKNHWHVSQITSKLSDLAGLFVFPLMLSAIFRLKKKKYYILVFILTGIIFTVINLSATASAYLVALLHVTGIDWQLWPDKTDLLALPALIFSYKYYQHLLRLLITGRPQPKRMLNNTILLISILACIHSGHPDTENKTSELEEGENLGLVATVTFRDAFAIENGFIVAQPDKNRLAKIIYNTNNKKFQVDSYFYHDGKNYLWSSIDISGIATSFDRPYDACLLKTKDVFWVLHIRRLTGFSLDSSQAPISADLSSISATSKILQLECNEEIVLLLNDNGTFSLAFFTKQGVFQKNLPISTTQVESGRSVIDIVHFKYTDGKLYLLETLEKKFSAEEQPYFLKVVSLDMQFKEGLFLYQAKSLFINDTTLMLQARQRGYNNEITLMALDLERKSQFISPSLKNKKGIFISSTPSTAEETFYFYLNYNGALVQLQPVDKDRYR